MGKEWARGKNRAVQLGDTALRDDTKAMEKSIDGLLAALASNKNVAKHKAAAVKAFVDFQDDRQVGGAGAGAHARAAQSRG